MVDAAEYFRALVEAFEAARHSIWILGWDIHSQVALTREANDAEGKNRLGPLLDRLARTRPELEVRILCWDFAMVYALERESFPVFRFDWSTHERVQFRLDGNHPVGASHHQKIVVVDGEVAFVGGIDLTTHRWDTPEHAPEEPRRATPSGVSFDPFHDVQVALSGPAARAVEALARERWERATDESIDATESENDPWPASLPIALRDVDVAIARTEPRFEEREEVREIERAYLDSIAAARETLYIENQYFSSSRVGEALCERLAEPDGPEVVFMGQPRCTGWLEEVTMGVMRARLLKKLEKADAHGRLRAIHPVVSRSEGTTVNVHAKVMIVDDWLARVGSSNLSNRSMGLDTECDALILASEESHREAIREFRSRLLGEHLGIEPEKVAAFLRDEGTLVALIDAHSEGDRGVAPISTEIEPWIDDLVPDEGVVDPESAIGADELAARLLHGEEDDEASGHPIRNALIVFATLSGLALAWRFGPLSEWLSPESIAGIARPLLDHPLGPLAIVGVFVVASLLMVPVTVLIVVSALLYGPATGGALALGGTVASSATAYWIGNVLWHDAVRRVGGRALNRLSRMLARRGILSMAAVRVFPVAPFTVVNLVAGASHMRFRDFLLGTVLAMTPGIAAMSFLSDRVLAAAQDPGASTLLGAVGALALLVGTTVFIRRRFARYGVTRQTST